MDREQRNEAEDLKGTEALGRGRVGDLGWMAQDRTGTEQDSSARWPGDLADRAESKVRLLQRSTRRTIVKTMMESSCGF